MRGNACAFVRTRRCPPGLSTRRSSVSSSAATVQRQMLHDVERWRGQRSDPAAAAPTPMRARRNTALMGGDDCVPRNVEADRSPLLPLCEPGYRLTGSAADVEHGPCAEAAPVSGAVRQRRACPRSTNCQPQAGASARNTPA